MPQDLKFDVTNKSQFALIKIFLPNESEIKVIIVMDSHMKEELPDLDHPRICGAKIFTICVSCSSERSMKLHIWESLFNIFPYIIGDFNCALTWSLQLSLDELEEKLLAKLFESSLFSFPIKVHNSCTRYKCPLRNNPLLKWAFKSSTEISKLTLKNIACTFLAKKCMNKVLEIADHEGIGYFKPANIRYESLLKKMSFFNIICLMDIEKVPEFKENYLKQLETLGIPPIIYETLSSFCPYPEEFVFEDLQTLVVREII